MKRFLLVVLVAAAGWVASEFVYRAMPARRAVERFIHRNDEPALLALKLREAARGEVVPVEKIDRELALSRAQFGDDDAYARAVKAAGLSADSLRLELTENLREQAWIEQQIAPSIEVNEAEARAFYQAKPEAFAEPRRFRARHIFLAAPDGVQPEVIAAKRSEIQGLSIRLLAGEKFDDLLLEASEDEANKKRGGDLGYFAAGRMPPEFIAEVEKMELGKTSSPVRSHLGFHLVQLTELKPARQLSYEETRTEIEHSLGEDRRAAALAVLQARLESK